VTRRILFLCTDAYGGHGGIALYNRDLAEALAMRAEVTVIPRVIGGDVGEIPPNINFVNEAARSNVAYLKTIARIRREPFDLVICGHVNLLPVAFDRPLLLAYGIEAWKPLKNALSRKLLHNCRAVAAISAVTRDRLLGWSNYAGPTHLLPNAIHAEDYGLRPKREDLIERYHLRGKRVLLTVGRLHSAERYKGFDEVLEVLPSLPSDVVYLIAGGGNDFIRLQKRAMDLGVGNRVVFTGLFEEKDKPDLYAIADVYVMPSRGEGFGFVFLEARATGMPAIGSKHDGGREALLDGELGLLVDPCNPAEIRAAILDLLQHGQRAIPERLDHFSFANFTRRANDIVDSVLMR
jgi:phosphatidyl-myo-inositol dimannoside synthase